MRLPHHSTIISLVALTASLGTGGAYAATKLAPNSVGSREVKDRSIRSVDLQPTARIASTNRVFRSAVVDVALDPSTQAAVNALAGAVKGERGDKGDTISGPAGATGATGPRGADGVTGVVVRENTQPIAGGGQSAAVIVQCDAGERALGGGARLDGGTQNAGTVQASYPVDGATAWETDLANIGTADGSVHGYAVCATVRP